MTVGVPSGHHVDLPRGPGRELVRDRKQSYELNGQESEALATIVSVSGGPCG